MVQAFFFVSLSLFVVGTTANTMHDNFMIHLAQIVMLNLLVQPSDIQNKTHVIRCGVDCGCILCVSLDRFFGFCVNFDNFSLYNC